MQVAGYDGDHPALELINSERWYGRRPSGGEDVLDDPRWLAGYLERWGFRGLPSPTQSDLSRLRSLRTVLRRAFMDVSTGGSITADDVSELDRALAGATVRRRIEARRGSYGLALEPGARDWRWIAAEIAASFVDLLETGDERRMKVCENSECLCAFYDESKNRSRRWCYPQVCGNLHKVRQFRARQRGRAPAKQQRR